MTQTNNNGIGFTGLLTILFIGLKLTGYINWSWIWVLSLIWISMIIGAILLLFAININKVNKNDQKPLSKSNETIKTLKV